MTTNNDLFIVDSADKVPPAPAGRHPLTPISGADFATSRRRLPAQVWMIITIAALAPVGLLLYGAWQAVMDAVIRWPWIVPFSGLLLLAALAAAGIVGLLALWSQARAASLQARVIRTAHGAPVDVGAALAINPMVAEAQQIQLYQLQAPYMQHPNLSTLSSSNQPTKVEPPAALSAPSLLVPAEEWLRWIDATPHNMIAGRTNAGKTTLATAIVGQRGNELLAVLDPHDQPGKWFGGTAIGGGRDYPAIMATLEALLEELDSRYERYNQGETSFERLTILIDEVPAIVLNGNQKWADFAKQLGSEARKVRMSAILLTQSPLVEDIKINSVMRQNFTRIALGDQVPVLLREERDSKRRQAMLDAVRGLAHPAAMEYRSEIHVLDTTNVPTLAAGQPSIRFWTPPTSKPRMTIEEILYRAVLAGKTRDQTRATLRSRGIEFANERWTEAVDRVRQERFQAVS